MHPGAPRSSHLTRRAPLLGLSALLLAVMTATVSSSNAWELLPGLAAFTLGAVLLCAVDLDQHRLPNAVLRPTATAVLASWAGASALTGRWAPLGWAVGMGAAHLAGWYVWALITGTLGLGDVKTGGLIGLTTGYLSPTTSLAAALTGILLGGLAAVIIKLRDRSATHLPYGPPLLAGAWLATVLALIQRG